MQREMIRLNIEYGRGPFGTWSIQYRSPPYASKIWKHSQRSGLAGVVY